MPHTAEIMSVSAVGHAHVASSSSTHPEASSAAADSHSHSHTTQQTHPTTSTPTSTSTSMKPTSTSTSTSISASTTTSAPSVSFSASPAVKASPSPSPLHHSSASASASASASTFAFASPSTSLSFLSPRSSGQHSHSHPHPHVISHSDGAVLESVLHSSTNEEEYTPKNILLTGGAGFIGSNVCCFLVKKYPQYKIIVLDKIDYCATPNNFEDLRTGWDDERKDYTYASNFKFIKGDILSADLVNHIVKDERIDTILHFAAQTHVDNSFGNSLSFTKANVLGTHILLETAILFRSQIKRFIHVSTDEVYGEASADANAVRMTETSVLNPTNPYAATKVAAEFLVKSYHTSFGLPTIITRGNNVYGPKQYPEKIIPKFIYLLDRKQPCPIHGDGTNRRSYLYVDDVCTAFDVIVHKGKVGEIYNVGSDTEMSNLDVLRSLLQLFGLDKDEEKYVKFVQDRAFNDFRYWIDTSSLNALGWKKQHDDFKQGLQKTISWYLSHRHHWDNVDSALSAHPQLSLDIRSENEEFTGVHRTPAASSAKSTNYDPFHSRS